MHDRMSKPARFWYVLMNIALASGYFAKIPTKKALTDAGLATMTGAERFWYALMCVSFGTGYFLKIPAAKAISEASTRPPARDDAPAIGESGAPSKRLIAAVALGAAIVVTLIASVATAGIRAIGSRGHDEPPSVSAAASSWHLDGIYRIDVDLPHGILRTGQGELIDMATLGLPAQPVFVARRSTCDPTGACEAVSISLDPATHQPDHEANTRLRWTGTQWVTSSDGPHHGAIAQNPCADDATNSDTWEVWSELTPLLDGTFTGVVHQSVTTDECGLAGDIRTIPVTAARIADAPADIFD